MFIIETGYVIFCRKLTRALTWQTVIIQIFLPLGDLQHNKLFATYAYEYEKKKIFINRPRNDGHCGKIKLRGFADIHNCRQKFYNLLINEADEETR